MRRKHYIYIIIIAGLLFLVSEMENMATDGADKLVDAFTNTDFEMVETDINTWGKYSNSYMTESELKSLVIEVATKLELEPEFDIQYIDNDYERITELTRISTDGTTRIKVTQRIEEVEKGGLKVENYLIVGIKLNNKCNSILFYKEKIDNIFSELGIQANDSLTVTSKTEGTMNQDEAKETMNKVLRYLNCQVKDEFESSKIYSVYAYSNYIDEHVITNGEKINVDLALTYNEEENSTYLYGAIPVITIDY